MEIRKAINRIGWRFGGNDNKHPFPVNETDIDAYNSISDYVEETQKGQFRNNELFGKLFILAYAKMIEHYKTDVFDDIPRKAMYKLLDRPIEKIIEDFTQRLNDSGKYAFIESVQGQIKHPATLSEARRSLSTQQMKNALKNAENVDLLIEDVWKVEDVKEFLTIEVNNALNILKK